MEESIKQIGERLKGLREVLNIPAQEVADLCGISLEHYQKIESGEADPSVYRLSKISKRYGIDAAMTIATSHLPQASVAGRLIHLLSLWIHCPTDATTTRTHTTDKSSTS